MNFGPLIGGTPAHPVNVFSEHRFFVTRIKIDFPRNFEILIPGSEPRYSYKKFFPDDISGGFILYARGSSSERLYQILNDPYNIAPMKLKLLHPKKIWPPFSPNSQGSGPNFCVHCTGTSKARQGKNFGNCTLAHFPEIEFRNFAENRFFSSYGKFLSSEKHWQGARVSPLWVGQSSPP